MVPGPAARYRLKTLARSVRPEFKQLINEQLKPLGFSGLRLDELTPNRTRRAQVGARFSQKFTDCVFPF